MGSHYLRLSEFCLSCFLCSTHPSKSTSMDLISVTLNPAQFVLCMHHILFKHVLIDEHSFLFLFFPSSSIAMINILLMNMSLYFGTLFSRLWGWWLIAVLKRMLSYTCIILHNLNLLLKIYISHKGRRAPFY